MANVKKRADISRYSINKQNEYDDIQTSRFPMAVAVAPASQTQTASYSVPITPNTAPVLDFQCLFSSDIRRKQKRWQDGRLKFHAFNKRVIVFDERKFKVGDTHFQQDYEFGEGEELELDGVGVLVQVGECVGRGVQDLSELLAKPLQEKEKRREARVAAAAVASASPIGTPARPSLSGLTPGTAQWQARPKPLSQVLGTPNGPLGRAAVPTRSPYEERQRHARGSEKENRDERPAKRRKPETAPSRAGYAQNLLGATLTLSTPSGTSSARLEPSRLQPIIKHRYNEHSYPIDLTTNETPPSAANFGTSSHATLEASGIRVTKARRKERVEIFKPERSGYAENLTGVPLTLSGTYGKPRSTGVGKDLFKDGITHSGRPQGLQSTVKSEAAGSSAPRKSNSPPRDDEVAHHENSVARPQNERPPKFMRDDDGSVDITSSPAQSSKSKKAPTKAKASDESTNDASVSKDISSPASNKRQKISKHKSMSTAPIEAPCPLSPIYSEESAHISAAKTRNVHTSELSAKGEARPLELLRIKSRPRRSMLISANHASSRASLDVSQSKIGEGARSRPRPDHQLVAVVGLSSSGNILSAPPHAMLDTDTHRHQSSSLDVVDDSLFSEPVNCTNDMTITKANEFRQHRFQKKLPVELGSLEAESATNPNSVGKGSRRVYEPPSSPGFEDYGHPDTDAMLSKQKNASPFAPKGLRKAIAQDKTLLALNHNAGRPLNHTRSAKIQSPLLKLAELQHRGTIACDTADFQPGSPRQMVNAAPRQFSVQQLKSGATLAKTRHSSNLTPTEEANSVLEAVKRAPNSGLIPAPLVATPLNEFITLENPALAQPHAKKRFTSDPLRKPAEPPQIGSNTHNETASRTESSRKARAPVQRRVAQERLKDAAALAQGYPAKTQESVAENIHAPPMINESNRSPAMPNRSILMFPEITAHKLKEHQMIATSVFAGPQPEPTDEQERGNVVHPGSNTIDGDPPANTVGAPEQLNNMLPQPPPKKPIIPNPATRGKKAAQKTDAAGKAPILGPIFPRPVLVAMPPQPPAPVHRFTRAHSGRVQNTGPANRAAEASGAEKLTAEAETDKGPWSKEAFDLFDWRPPNQDGGLGDGEGVDTTT